MIGSIGTPSIDAEGMLVGPVAVADAGLKSYQELKESGVSWLGKVPAHWKVRHLGRIGRFFKGGGGTKEDERQDGIPCVRYGDLYTYHRFFITASRACVAPDLAATVYTPIRYGDVLFAGSGETIDEIGKSAVNLIRGPACCGGDVIIFRPSIDAEARFLGYAADCSASVHQKACIGRGFTVMHIYSTDLKYMAVAIPPVPEQAAIVRFLDHADRRIRRYIRAKQKLIALLEEQKQAVIHRAVTRGLDPTVRLRPSAVRWLGDIPEHWEIWQIGHLGQVGNGSTPSRSNMGYWDGGTYPWLNSSSVNHSPITQADQFVTDLALRECHLPRVQTGSVLVAITGQGKTRGISAALDTEATINQHVAYVTPRNDVIGAEYLQLALSAAYRELRAISDDSGSTKGALTCWDISHFRVPLPPRAEQAEITLATRQATKTLESTSAKAAQEVMLAREYGTRLIADVVTGKLDVREAAARLPDEADELEPLDEAETLIDGEEEPTDVLATAP